MTTLLHIVPKIESAKGVMEFGTCPHPIIYAASTRDARCTTVVRMPTTAVLMAMFVLVLGMNGDGEGGGS